MWDILFSSYIQQIITICCINIIIVLGLNFITGVTGQLSLGHAAFCSIGAYSAAILVINTGAPFAAAILFGGITAALAGILLGIPILRLRGDYLAIATLGFCEIIRVIFLNLKATRGALGINGIPPYTTITIAFILAIVAVIIMYNLEHSKIGLAMRSIREDEIASEMMGINISKYKLMAFAIGSALAGVGGVLYAFQITIITPGDFGFTRSVEYLCMLVLGGMGSIVGVIAGVIILVVVPQVLYFAPEYRMVMYGAVLVMIMVFRPQGLFGKLRVNL